MAIPNRPVTRLAEPSAVCVRALMSTPRGQKCLYAFQITFAGGKVNRGESLFGIGGEIGMRLDERLHDIGVTLRGGPHQRRLILRWLFRVDGRAVLDQNANRVRAAAPRASHQRSFSSGYGCVWIAARFQQQPHQRGISVGAGFR